MRVRACAHTLHSSAGAPARCQALCWELEVTQTAGGAQKSRPGKTGAKQRQRQSLLWPPWNYCWASWGHQVDVATDPEARSGFAKSNT